MFSPALTLYFVTVQHHSIISHSLPMRNLLLQLLYVVTKGHMNYHYSLASKFRDIKSIFKNHDIAEQSLAEFTYDPISKIFIKSVHSQDFRFDKHSMLNHISYLKGECTWGLLFAKPIELSIFI